MKSLLLIFLWAVGCVGSATIGICVNQPYVGYVIAFFVGVSAMALGIS